MALRESRAGRVAPVLAILFAAFLADMALQRAVSWLEDTSGQQGAQTLARLVAEADAPAELVARAAAVGEARVVSDRADDARYPFLPKLYYRAHATRPGQALARGDDADKAVADAFRRPEGVYPVGALYRGVRRVAGLDRTAAVADVPRPDWSGSVTQGRIVLAVTAGLGLLAWLLLLGRPARRRWHAAAGAGIALVAIGGGLVWTWLGVQGAHEVWATAFQRGIGIEAAGAAVRVAPGSLGQMALMLFAAPVLPLALTAVIGWITESRRSPNRAAFTYIAPAMVGMGVLILAPFAFGVLLAFTRHDHGHFTFVGLQNFVRILSTDGVGFWTPLSFYYTLAVTVLWTALNVVLHASIGLGLALLLKEPTLRLKAVYRVLLIVPWAVPNYITALIWKGMFNKQYGLINTLLDASGVLGVVGAEPIAWFSGFWTSFMANVTTNTWLGFPFMMVVSLGALQSIPKDLYEAADVDGASRWQQFTHITLPLLRPAMVPAIILGSVWTFNMFNIIYLVSGGQPNNSTDILITEAYRWAFEQDRYGYAAAYSLLIFVVLLGYSTLTNRVSKGAEATYG